MYCSPKLMHHFWSATEKQPKSTLSLTSILLETIWSLNTWLAVKEVQFPPLSKPSYIGSLVSCVTILLSVLLLSYHSILPPPCSLTVLLLYSPTALFSYCFATLFSHRLVLLLFCYSILPPPCSLTVLLLYSPTA